MNFLTVFLILEVVFMIGVAVGFVFLIIAMWRLSKAHMELAGNVKAIAENLKSIKEP